MSTVTTAQQTHTLSEVFIKSSWANSYDSPLKDSLIETSSGPSLTDVLRAAHSTSILQTQRDVIAACDLASDPPYILPYITGCFHCLC